MLLLIFALLTTPPDPPRFERLDARDGLPHNTVTALHVDQRGFLWAGTADGLARYDGHRFVVFRRRLDRTQTLTSNAIQGITETPDGTLWVATPGGVCRLDDEARERFTCLSPAVDIPDLFYAEGSVWAVSHSGVLRYDVATGRPHRVRFESLARNPRYWGHRGRFGAITHEPGGYTVHRYDAEHDRIVDAGSVEAPPGSFPYIDDSGDVALVASPPLAALADPTAQWWQLGLVTMRGPDGALWVGTREGLFRYAGGATRRIPLPDTSPLSRAVIATFVDAPGTVWAATRDGLYVHDPAQRHFEHATPAGPDTPAPVMALATDAAGVLWTGTLGSGLFRQSPGQPPEAARLGGPEDQNVWALHATEHGLWVGTDGGLCRQNGSVGCIREPLARWDDRSFIYALEPAERGTFWAGGSALVRVDARTGRIVQRVDVSDLEAFTTITLLKRSAAGGLWVGVENRGLWRLGDDGGLERSSAATLANTSAWSLLEAAPDSVWLGTSDGLFLYRPRTGRVEHHAADLPASTVYSILPHGDALWLATARGLARYVPASRTLRVFAEADGVRNREFNRRAAHRAPDGTLFFGGMEGVTRFDPAAFTRSDPPPAALVMRVLVDEPGATRTLGATALRLGPSARAFTVEVTAPRPAGGTTRLAYRLDPFDPDWIDADDDRRVRYTGLPPGRYTFRTRASADGTTWGEEAVLAVAILPPWHGLWWVRLLGLVALASLGVAVYRRRVAALRREERMRWRIASDLHDDIGSGLASVALLTERVRDKAALDAAEADQLTAAAQAARTMVQSLREIVWFVDPAHDRPGAFAAKVQATAAHLVGPRATVEAHLGRLDGAPLPFRRTVFLILKEALHNAARHAPGAAVQVRLGERSGTLTLVVADGGPGFDADAVHDGTGLRSLRRRAERIGGTLTVETAPGAGTTVTLTAPIP